CTTFLSSWGDYW
nr:immunoglobulin heavy chain junction region [Macaca mulatta]MOV41763.1 immunoglobulin heavy chain junction region [Macaca mulatta]MOV45548.1 immunoglobulin heavy chain junction region [Macaca mulatta]MOV86577.1 immunoglobulin heavy chain junction region [Macaca mulatta]MOV87513.1 immunoglobulin heavy chain junction region [Macaca mulatta]